MINLVIKFAFSAIIGVSVLMLGGPAIGEMFSTMAPFFTKSVSASADELNLPYEDVIFGTTDDLMLHGWFFPADYSNAPALIYAPSTSNDQRTGLSLVKPFHDAGYHVLLFSYRGHGSSEGNRFGFTYGANESLDIDAAVRFLKEQKGVERIGAMGHSAGASAIIMSAARNPDINAVVAASPYTNLEELWETSRPGIIIKPVFKLMMTLTEWRKGFSREQIQPVEMIDQIAPQPILLVHGLEDKRITEEQALRLYEAAQYPKTQWLIEGATHADVRFPVLDMLVSDIIRFFDQALLVAHP
jgi:dipeptidyl aminopeptidase/acylaminoacyl peptidase